MRRYLVGGPGRLPPSLGRRVRRIISIAIEGNLQKSLDITYNTASTYHIEFGEPKSNTMPIKNNRKKAK